jgi:hypothetical protein
MVDVDSARCVYAALLLRRVLQLRRSFAPLSLMAALMACSARGGVVAAGGGATMCDSGVSTAHGREHAEVAPIDRR